MAISADAEESKNLLTDGEFETPVEIIRENSEKGHIVTKGWMLIRGRDGNSRRWEITSQTAAEGKKSIKLTNTTGQGHMHLKLLPERPVSEFTGPYRVSCRIKTRGRADPARTPVMFLLGGRQRGTGLTSKTVVAEIPPKKAESTNWTRYSAVIGWEDTHFKTKHDFWFVSIRVKSFRGSVWVDDVQLVPVEAPALRVRLNSKECFLHQKQMIVKGAIHPNHIADLWKTPLRITLLDSGGKVISIKRRIIKTKNITVPLDIAELPEGRYTVQVGVEDKNGKTLSLKRTFRRTEGPIPPPASKKAKRK